MSGAAVERYVSRVSRGTESWSMVIRRADPDEPADFVDASAHDAAIAALTAELQQCREALEVARKYVCAIRDQASIAGWAEVNRDLQKVDAALKERT